MAISKQRKEELVNKYRKWLNQSQALFMTEYTGLSMKQVDDLRAKVREVGGGFHIIKNTLAKVAFEVEKLPAVDKLLEGSTAIVFAYNDTAGMAKALSEFSRTNELVKIKGGYLDRRPISAAEVKALADLPPLPVLHAQLLGTIMAPATKLARTLAEPGRQLASIFQAYADREAAPAAG